jgi:hypothetical protein
MDALCRATAKSNRRGRDNGPVVSATATQAVQAQGKECGSLRAPLWCRHARRVVQVGRSHGLPANCQIRSQCPNELRALYRSAAYSVIQIFDSPI